MSRPRTPTSIMDARGAFNTHPERRRVDPEVSGELGNPPAHFDEAHAAIWHELADNFPVGVAKNADRFAVEVVCNLMCKFRQPSGLKGAELAPLVSLLKSMGLTPADRARVAAPMDTKTETNLSVDFKSA